MHASQLHPGCDIREPISLCQGCMCVHVYVYMHMCVCVYVRVCVGGMCVGVVVGVSGTCLIRPQPRAPNHF